MSTTTVLLIILVVWIAIGVVAAIYMGRRGHTPFTWMTLGAVLGPLVIPAMAGTVRHGEPAHTTFEPPDVRGDAQHGIDVLFGYDGSQESRGALVTALNLFGPHLGRLTIATVLAFDAPAERAKQADADLAEIASLAAARLEQPPETLTLVGRPDEALVQHARDHSFGLIVIAPRGHGMSHALFGSVASRLARTPGVPVAIMPAAQRSDG